MASPWIKVEHVTPDKPEVDAMANLLGMDVDTVVGKVVRFWIWADQQSISGNGISVTKALLDRITYCKGFTDALVSVGWLQEENGIFCIPNFDRHNGQSAKSRAITGKRVENHRNPRNGYSVTKALPEKRREEKSKEQHPLPPEGESAWAKFRSTVESLFGKAASQVSELKQYRHVNELVALGATPEELQSRTEHYRKCWPDVACTLQAVLNNWETIPTLKPKGQTNGTHRTTRSERLDADAAEFLRDLGGASEGGGNPTQADSPVGGARNTLTSPSIPARG